MRLLKDTSQSHLQAGEICDYVITLITKHMIEVIDRLQHAKYVHIFAVASVYKRLISPGVHGPKITKRLLKF
jgi:hypothetical protein